MRPVGWMVGASVGSWLVAALATGPTLMVDVLAGMVAPLVVAVVTWELAERTFRQSPERLTAVMITAFAGKMVFFGAYVAIMLMGFSLRPVPFVVSFTAYFIGLHLTEALFLKRLFANSTAGPR